MVNKGQAILTKEERNSFVLLEEDENSFESATDEPVTFEPDNSFHFHMIEDPENQCLYVHFERFNSTNDGAEEYCYYLQNEKSYDDVFETCANHEYHSHMYLLRATHFRLAEG